MGVRARLLGAQQHALGHGFHGLEHDLGVAWLRISAMALLKRRMGGRGDCREREAEKGKLDSQT